MTEQHPWRFLYIWRWPLHWQILIGLIIGASIGIWMGHHAIATLPADVNPAAASQQATAHVEKSLIYDLLSLMGDLFIQGLKLIVVPLVVSSIVLAVAQMANGSDFGRLGLKTLGYYMITSLVAILIGLVLINFFSPGVRADGQGILYGQDLSAFASDQASVEAQAGGKSGSDFLNVFRAMIPSNIFHAAANNDLLGLIVVALLVGYSLSRLTGKANEVLMAGTQGVYDITLRITDWVLRMAPIGVIGLLAVTFSTQYATLAGRTHEMGLLGGEFGSLLGGIGKFALVVLAGLLVHMLITMPLILWLIARVSPLKHYRALMPALITAFSTASSSATLPVTMDCVENRAGVSNRIASFVLPLGATVNMDGTALYECAAAIFICQAFGVDLSYTQQFMVVVIALLTSIGVAGVPAASLVAIIIILQAVQGQLPADAPKLISALGLLFIFDRPLDMCRTAVNIFSDSVGAVTIARTEVLRTAMCKSHLTGDSLAQASPADDGM